MYGLLIGARFFYYRVKKILFHPDEYQFYMFST